MKISQHSTVALNTRAAAAYLSVSQSGLNRWRRHGGGPAYMRLGKRIVRYRLCDPRRLFGIPRPSLCGGLSDGHEPAIAPLHSIALEAA